MFTSFPSPICFFVGKWQGI